LAEQSSATKPAGVYERSEIMSRKTKTPASEKASAIRRATPAKVQGATHKLARQVSPAHLLQQAFNAPETLAPADILALQRTAGNRAVGQIIAAIAGQTDTALSTHFASSANPIQRQTEDEETIQGKFEPLQKAAMSADGKPIQRLEDEEEEPLQGKFQDEPSARLPVSARSTSNQTGMPDQLKTGIEVLSGMDLSDVRVHFNSDKPAQVNALAYTQGNNIYLRPGMEKHLAHEAWHVVQQREGRVKPTLQAKGVAINDDSGLENEADIMGSRAEKIVQRKASQCSFGCACPACVNPSDGSGVRAIAQAKFATLTANPTGMPVVIQRKKWKCPTCTTLNDVSVKVCGSCRTVREETKSPAPAPAKKVTAATAVPVKSAPAKKGAGAGEVKKKAKKGAAKADVKQKPAATNVIRIQLQVMIKNKEKTLSEVVSKSGPITQDEAIAALDRLLGKAKGEGVAMGILEEAEEGVKPKVLEKIRSGTVGKSDSTYFPELGKPNRIDLENVRGGGNFCTA
jgi:hypothetical protein